jgi:ParB family transcriptional regulator, chromosome partitioning protein
MQFSKEPVSRLQPNPWNTNRITDPANAEKLRESLRRFGAFKPIIVRTLNGGQLEILGGEHRWIAAQEIGLKEVPVVNLGLVDDKRAKEIGLVDNGRYGEDDALGLQGLLKDLGEDVLKFMPYSDTELKSIMEASAVSLDDLDSVVRGDLPDLNDVKAAPTSQVLRFKVPVEDVQWMSKMIEDEMKRQGFKDEDSLTNAGHALISLLKRLRDGK